MNRFRHAGPERRMARPAEEAQLPGGVAPGVRSGRYSPRSVTARTRSGRHGVVRILALLAVVGAIVVGVGLTVVGPAVASAVTGLAAHSPSLMKVGPVAQLVRSQLGSDLTAPAGTDPTPVHFTVDSGETVTQVADALHAQGLLHNPLAFVYLVVTEGRTDQIQAGAYDLNASMTPQAVIDRLQQAPIPVVTVRLRESLRLEQIVAYLETLDLKTNLQAFYQLALHPPASLIADYPFLATLPAGHSLEGFLGPGTFQVYQDITPEALLRTLLDQWQATIGMGPVEAAQRAGKNFYQVLILASIVEQEAVVNSERPLIAGVYANRLARKMLLNADPTVIYGWDTANLRKLPFDQWKQYAFWEPIGKPLAGVTLPADLAGFQTYKQTGQVPWPICTPSLASIEAALNPDTRTGYLYFVAKGDGTHTHAFSRTLAEQNANLRKYGYQ